MLKVIPQISPPGCPKPARRGHRRLTSHLALLGLASLTAGWFVTANAGEHLYNFDPPNGDPAANGFIVFGVNAPNAWHTNTGFSGADGDGFLEITPAANGQNLGVLFPLDY